MIIYQCDYCGKPTSVDIPARLLFTARRLHGTTVPDDERDMCEECYSLLTAFLGALRDREK